MRKPLANITGEVFDLLTARSFIRVDPGKGAVWLLDCECGDTCERHLTVLRSNKRRGYRMGCGTCVPMKVRHITDEDKREARRIRNAKYRGTDTRTQSKDTRRNRVRSARAAAPAVKREPVVVTERAYVVDGKSMGVVKSDRDIAWLRRTFPGGVVTDNFEASAPLALADASVRPPTSGATP